VYATGSQEKRGLRDALEAEEDPAVAATHWPTEGERTLRRDAVKLGQVFYKQRLVRKFESMRTTKERRTDDHSRWAKRNKRSEAGSTKRRGASGTKAIVEKETPPRETKGVEGKAVVAEVLMVTVELLMFEMMLVPERCEGARVVMWPKKLLVVEVFVMTESVVMAMGTSKPRLWTVVAKTATEATRVAEASREMAPSEMTTTASSTKAHATCPNVGIQRHKDHSNNQSSDANVFHGA
jgi:hypothetical protein